MIGGITKYCLLVNIHFLVIGLLGGKSTKAPTAYLSVFRWATDAAHVSTHSYPRLQVDQLTIRDIPVWAGLN